MNLAETQALFHAAITSGDVPAGAVDACFTGSEALPAADRVAIYAEMFFWRQAEALRTAFPALAAALAEERFTALCRDYLRAHPSEHHDIGRLGRELPGFLVRHPAPERPDLSDLAELEWARSEVFFEAEAVPVGREALGALGPTAFPRARLRMVPALRLLRLQHPAQEAWRRALRGEAPVPEPAEPVHLAIWRQGHEVFHGPLDANEAGALRAAMAGEPLLEVCARFAAVDEPVTAGFVALASWIDEGWVAGVEAPADVG